MEGTHTHETMSVPDTVNRGDLWGPALTVKFSYCCTAAASQTVQFVGSMSKSSQVAKSTIGSSPLNKSNSSKTYVILCDTGYLDKAPAITGPDQISIEAPTELYMSSVIWRNVAPRFWFPAFSSVNSAIDRSWTTLLQDLLWFIYFQNLWMPIQYSDL